MIESMIRKELFLPCAKSCLQFRYHSYARKFQFLTAINHNYCKFNYVLNRSFSKAQSKRDYYEVLGVSKSATKDEIKKKFRELAKKFHPDLNKDDKSAESKFREVSEAYETLEDDKKRQMYDNFGHSGVDQNFSEHNHADGFNPFGGFHQGFQSNFHSAGPLDAEDVMEMFFGGAMNSRPVEVQVKLSFFEAVQGCIDDGMSLRSPGNGRDGSNNQSAGDLVISFSVNPDPYFERNGDDILVNVPISFTQAILGGSVDVLTIGKLTHLKNEIV